MAIQVPQRPNVGRLFRDFGSHVLPALDHMGQERIATERSAVAVATPVAPAPMRINVDEIADSVFVFFEDDARAELKAAGKKKLVLHATPAMKHDYVARFLAAVGLTHVGQPIAVESVTAAGIEPIHDYVIWVFGQNDVVRTICDAATMEQRVANCINAAGGVAVRHC